jgi:threonylcarbamoyladenosine tRNA methylthiotransferase MtaB
VTQISDKKSRQIVSRAHSVSPDAAIIVTGCYAQRAAGEVITLPGVRLVLGTGDRSRIVGLAKELLLDGKTVNEVRDIAHDRVFEPISATRDEKTRAHLKIQEGCDRFCSYCIIPYARGPVRSRPLESVRQELLTLEQKGYSEVVLTGIHLMSYGKDIGNVSLKDAIACAEGLTGIRRIRLGSLEPLGLTDDFIDHIANDPKVCRHFHVSLQSGSAGVLRRMNRRYSPEEYEDRIKKLREAMPDCAVTTDIIAGFPGETEKEFEETIEFVKKIRFARIHVFPYSRRAGTKAAQMPEQILNSVKHERAGILIELGKQLEGEYISRFTGTCQEVLFEAYSDGFLEGYTGTYIRVSAPSKIDLTGRISDVLINRSQNEMLFGSVVD